MSAYQTVDAYLNSLPDTNPKNMKLCANKYKKNIIDFELCNKNKLNEISKFKNTNAKVDGTDYSSNNNVINAIKNACGYSN